MAGQRVVLRACALLLAGVVCSAGACELVLTEHRSGRHLLTVPLLAQPPIATVRFTHSVLGTPVADRYEWRTGAGQTVAHLVEERYEGDGYGLPNAAGPGETLVRDGPGWRLSLNRVVHPLVVPPVQGMRLEIAGQPPVVLQTLSVKSIEFRAVHCAAP